jgi:hypothetical protein
MVSKTDRHLPVRQGTTYSPERKLLWTFEEAGHVAGKIPRGHHGILEYVRQIDMTKARGRSKVSVRSVPGVAASFGFGL